MALNKRYSINSFLEEMGEQEASERRKGDREEEEGSKVKVLATIGG